MVRIRNNIVDVFDEVSCSTVDENTLGVMFLSGWVVAGLLTGMIFYVSTQVRRITGAARILGLNTMLWH